MTSTNLVWGGLEVVGGIAVIATFVTDVFSGNPVVWRVLAIFMILAGARRIRNGLQNSSDSSPSEQ